VAFNAVVSIGVIGLYWCFAIPIWQRLKMGDRFERGEWTLGAKYKVIAILALIDIVITSVSAFMPTSNLGAPWFNGFGWRYVNYTILVVPAAMLMLWIYWHLSVKKWFTGPKQMVQIVGQENPGS